MSAAIIRRGVIPSTMTEAAALALAGCPHGTAVVAEGQTAGIGRHGHSWHSEPSAGLYVSVVLRLEIPAAELPVLTLALGLATAEALALTAGLACDLRWPNDILSGGRKLAGILVQIVDNAAIAGIGVNVNHLSFPPDLTQEATSLRIATGRPVDREAVLQALLHSVEGLTHLFVTEGKPTILKLFAAASSFATGKQVTVDLGNRTIQGVTDGLTDEGFLRVYQPNGAVEIVVAGGVRPA